MFSWDRSVEQFSNSHMSVLKVIKDTSKLLTQETDETSNPGEIFLIADSKGKHLNPVIPGRVRAYLNIIYESGATIDSA